MPLLEKGIFGDGVDHGVELISRDKDFSVDDRSPGYNLDRGWSVPIWVYLQ